MTNFICNKANNKINSNIKNNKRKIQLLILNAIKLIIEL